MKIATLRRKAIPYYACYIAQSLENTSSITLDDLRRFSYSDPTPFESGRFRLDDKDTLAAAAEYLAHKALIKFIPDEFGPDIIVRSDDFFENWHALQQDEDSVFYKHAVAGDGGDTWIGSALDTINKQLSEAEPESEGSEEISADEWEPLAIDRDSESFRSAMEATEKAIETIEQNNGYATSAPEERDGIVNTLRGTLDALKHGRPSRGAVMEGMLSPLKYISKKFSDSVMGEIAKVAVTALIKWLFPF
jgi:hypothetical protein